MPHIIQKIFAIIVAVILLVLGVWGIFSENILGLFTLNIGHAMLHIILGIGGIVMVLGNKPANFNGTAGYLLTIFGLLGLIPAVRILMADMLNINMNIIYLWIGIGVLSLIVYFTRQRPKRDPDTGEVIEENTDEEVTEPIENTTEPVTITTPVTTSELKTEPIVTTEVKQEQVPPVTTAPIPTSSQTPTTPPTTPASDAAAVSTPPTTNAISPQPSQTIPPQQVAPTTQVPPTPQQNIATAGNTSQQTNIQQQPNPTQTPPVNQEPEKEPFHYNPSTSAERAKEEGGTQQPNNSGTPENPTNKV